MAWKYVMLESQVGDLKVLFPIIFPDKLVHDRVVQQLRTIVPGYKVGLAQFDGVRVVSAGSIEYLDVHGLGGKSETLDLVSRPDEDTNVIENYSYLHGLV
jgi:hypothetical protein